MSITQSPMILSIIPGLSALLEVFLAARGRQIQGLRTPLCQVWTDENKT